MRYPPDRFPRPVAKQGFHSLDQGVSRMLAYVIRFLYLAVANIPNFPSYVSVMAFFCPPLSRALVCDRSNTSFFIQRNALDLTRPRHQDIDV